MTIGATGGEGGKEVLCDLVNSLEESGFYPENNGESLRYFKQGSK